ncbi:hypothetical protein KP509_36G028600 [Ceratopteris richardii]|uniref:Uncharacterized protein n=1 Tax=Ceratopteris richardii TaxID=49495 RepID=A0A8T2QB81_CERRI|nr:hypothetical protein KP509_36G028600 [Ceratopteris richardii]
MDRLRGRATALQIREGAERGRNRGDTPEGSGIVKAVREAFNKVLRLVFKAWCNLHSLVPFVAAPSYSFEAWKQWLYNGLVTYLLYPYARDFASRMSTSGRTQGTDSTPLTSPSP